MLIKWFFFQQQENLGSFLAKQAIQGQLRHYLAKRPRDIGLKISAMCVLEEVRSSAVVAGLFLRRSYGALCNSVLDWLKTFWTIVARVAILMGF